MIYTKGIFRFPLLPFWTHKSQKMHTGCPNMHFCLGNQVSDFQIGFSPENWDLYVHFAYRTISVLWKGAEIFTKKIKVLEQINLKWFQASQKNMGDNIIMGVSKTVFNITNTPTSSRFKLFQVVFKHFWKLNFWPELVLISWSLA